MAIKFKIDKEFSTWMPPLQPEEFEKLKEGILLEGCRDALVIWAEEGILIDGHNRYRICTENDIPFTTHKMSFDYRDDVFVWIYNNSMSRRNLQPIDKVKMVTKMKPVFERQAKERMEMGRPKASEEPKEIFPEVIGQTRDQLGALVGVSGKTYSALAKINDYGDPEIIDAVRNKIIGAEAAAGIIDLPKEEQSEILNDKKALKNKIVHKKRTKKEIEEQKDTDKRYSAESRQLFDLALHQMERIRNEDIYGIIVLKEMKQWCIEKIKIIKRGLKK